MYIISVQAKIYFVIEKYWHKMDFPKMMKYAILIMVDPS